MCVAAAAAGVLERPGRRGNGGVGGGRRRSKGEGVCVRRGMKGRRETFFVAGLKRCRGGVRRLPGIIKISTHVI